MVSEFDLKVSVAAMEIIGVLKTKRFYPAFKILKPPRELAKAGRERFEEAQRDKRRAHYEACVKAEREFIEDQLRGVGAAAVKALGEVFDNWTPTAKNINALPEPVRRFIHDIETNADPSQTVRENTILKDMVTALEKRVEELEGMVAAATTGAGVGAALGQVPEGLVLETNARTLSEQFHACVIPGDTVARTTHVCLKAECNLQLIRLSRSKAPAYLYVCPQHGPLYGWLPEDERAEFDKKHKPKSP